MNQDLLAALNQAFAKANAKRSVADERLSKCQNRVEFIKDRLRVLQEQTRREAFRYEEGNNRHKALLDHYKDSADRPRFIDDQLQDLVNNMVLADKKVKTSRAAEESCKRELEEAESALAFAEKEEREAAQEIIAVNQEIQRANNLN
ncbi:MAG: hypothetical protein HY619_05555 [Thaumarchaeota archaeon]|nr:hypothetical protein [Nitrososphaerota archaeon]